MWSLGFFRGEFQIRDPHFPSPEFAQIPSPNLTNRTPIATDLTEARAFQLPCSRTDCVLDKRLTKLETRLDCLTQLDRGCCGHGMWRCADCGSQSPTPRHLRLQTNCKSLDTIGVQTPRSMLLQGNIMRSAFRQTEIVFV